MSNFPEFEFGQHVKAKKQGADRGKELESELSKAFKALKEADKGFDFDKVPDAYSSRGGFSTPRVGDYTLYLQGKALVLEAKEVAHDHRLPRKNFPKDERARINRRRMAGIHAMVIIKHTTNDTYRLLDADWFNTEMHLGDTGSWDLSDFVTCTLQEAIDIILRWSKRYDAHHPT